jgi:hypothetical protein
VRGAPAATWQSGRPARSSRPGAPAPPALDHLGIGIRRVGQRGIHQAQGLGAALRPDLKKQTRLRHSADPLQAGGLGQLRGQGALGALGVPRDSLDGLAALAGLAQVGTNLFPSRRASSDQAIKGRRILVAAESMPVEAQRLGGFWRSTLGNQQAARPYSATTSSVRERKSRNRVSASSARPRSHKTRAS